MVHKTLILNNSHINFILTQLSETHEAGRVKDKHYPKQEWLCVSLSTEHRNNTSNFQNGKCKIYYSNNVLKTWAQKTKLNFEFAKRGIARLLLGFDGK